MRKILKVACHGAGNCPLTTNVVFFRLTTPLVVTPLVVKHAASKVSYTTGHGVRIDLRRR
jgi:hypothetical protein